MAEIHFTELCHLLEDLGVDPPEMKGYGHITSDELAEKLIEKFHVELKRNDGQDT